MKVSDPFKMNDWPTSRFLILFISCSFIYAGSFGWTYFDFDMIFLRVFSGALLLFIFPGFMLLRLIGVHNIPGTRSIGYAIGLSIGYVMIVGLVLNSVCTIIHLDYPLSLNNLSPAILFSEVLLCAACYYTGRDGIDVSPQITLNPKSVMILTLLFFSVMIVFVGSRITDLAVSSHLFVASLIMVIGISLVVVLTDAIDEGTYPVILYMLTLSVLLQSWGLSQYIWGRDIHLEYYFSNLVYETSSWDFTIASNTNSMLSVVILVPASSIMLGLDITWVFKFVIPLLCALVPLMVYDAATRMISPRMAFSAAILFLSLGFFSVSLLSAKQLLAELFLILLITVTLNTDSHGFGRTFLLLSFGFSLIVTHYGTAVLFSFCLVFVWIISRIALRQGMSRRSDVSITPPFSEIFPSISDSRRASRHLSFNFVALFMLVLIAWTIYTTSSSSLSTFAEIGSRIAGSLTSDVLDPETAQGLGFLVREPQSLLGLLHKVVHYAVQFLILIGVGTRLFNRDSDAVNKYHNLFAAGFLLLLVMSIVVPHFSSAIYTPRLYSIGLLILSPFALIGGAAVQRSLTAAFRRFGELELEPIAVKLTALMILLLFMFEIGIARELMGVSPNSIPLSGYRMIDSASEDDRGSFYYDFNTCEQDVRCVEWLHDGTSMSSVIYSDSTAKSLYSYGMMGYGRDLRLLSNTSSLEPESLILFDGANIVGGIFYTISSESSAIQSSSGIISQMITANKVYSNGGSEVYAWPT